MTAGLGQDTTMWQDKKRSSVADGTDRPDAAAGDPADRLGDEPDSAGRPPSQVLFWIGPILLYVVLPALDLRFGADGQNPPDEVMEWLENDKYYRYCTYLFIPFQYLSLVLGAYLFTASNLSWLGYDGPLSWPAKIGLALSVGHPRRSRHQHRARDGTQEGVAGALAVQDHPGADRLRAFLHRAQPRPPRPGGDTGRPGVGPLR